MLKQRTDQTTVALTDHKKEKICEKVNSFQSKRKTIIKSVKHLVEQYDQEIYICLMDKKTSKVYEYSSNTKEFSLEKVQSLV